MRVLPTGEYDAEDEQVDGVQEEETIDSGNEEIRSGQGQIKFKSLANKIGEASKNAVYFAVALAEEEQKGGADHNATDDEDDEESNSSSDESEHGRVFSFAGAAPAGDGSQSNTTHNVQSTSSRGARGSQRQTPSRPGAKSKATPNANVIPPQGRSSTNARTSPKLPSRASVWRKRLETPTISWQASTSQGSRRNWRWCRPLCRESTR